MFISLNFFKIVHALKEQDKEQQAGEEQESCYHRFLILRFIIFYGLE